MSSGFSGVFKNRKFVYLWGSQIFSQLTVNFLTFVLLLRIYEQTRSTFATSFIWVSYALPAIIIGPFAASFVDLADRKKVLMTATVFQFLVVLLFSFVYEKYLYFSYLVVLGYSFFNQFYVPAEAASLPVVLNRKHLAYGNGLFFLTQQAALAAGFGIAGVLNEFLGFGVTLFISACFLLGAFVCVSLLPSMKVSKIKALDFENRVREFFKQIFEGYSFLKAQRRILMAFGLLLTLQVSVAVLTTNLPVIAGQLLDVRTNLASVYVVVPAGIGAVLGALTFPRMLSRKRVSKRNVIQLSLVLVTLVIWLLVFLEPMLERWSRITAGMILFLAAGFFFLGLIIPAQTFLQENTPKQMMGRVFGNFWFLTTAATVFPVIFSATITDVLGVGTLLLLLSCVSAGAFAFSTVYVRLTR